MLSTIIKIKDIHQNEDTDFAYAIVRRGPLGDSRGTFVRPVGRGHEVGDLWVRFSMILAGVVQPCAFLSCFRVTLQVTNEYVLKSEGPLADQ